jgi:hypothetical protein
MANAVGDMNNMKIMKRVLFNSEMGYFIAMISARSSD